MCGQIHAELWTELSKARVECAVTIGDIEVGGRREFGTTYEQLEHELSGALRNGDKPYPFHVWLTFPDWHIIDATYFFFKHQDLPPPWTWKWSDYVVCSDHPFSNRIDARYIPYLVGDATLVERIIFDEATGAADGSAAGKVGRNEPCPCGSGKKFKKCHGLMG